MFICLTIAPIAFAQEADLGVGKSGPDQDAADTDVPYTITVFNAGPDDAAAVTVNDPIPAGMTFVSAAQTGGFPGFTCSNPPGVITCTIAALPAGETAELTFVLHIAPATPPGTTFINTVTISSDTFDPNDENNSAVAGTSTPPPPQSDLGISKNGPATAGPDTDVTYTIVVSNGGPDDSGGVAVADTLPGNMTLVSLTQSGEPMTCTTPAVGFGGMVNCSAAPYPFGATTTLTLTGHVPAGTPSGTVYVNTASVSSNTEDPNNENNSSGALTEVSSADIVLTKTGPATATAGDDIAYSLTIANAGPDAAAGAAFADALPPGTTFVSLTQNNGPAATCNTPAMGANGSVTCELLTLANGASANFTLVVHIGNTSSITNTVEGGSGEFDPNQGNNTSSVPTSVTPVADLAVTKNGPATVTAGLNVQYTITVTNPDGPSDAPNVTLTDVLPPDTTFVSLVQTSGPTFTCATPAFGGTGSVTCTIDPFPLGASATFSLTVHLASSAADGGSLSNTATVMSPADPDQTDDSSTTTAVVIASADLAVTKTGPPSTVYGNNIQYSLTVTNAGPSDAATVALSDPLPPNTSFVSLSQTSGPVFTCATPPSGGTGTVTCTIATFPAGASATFTLVVYVSPTTATSISNTATVSSPTDTDDANDASTATTEINAPADIPALSPLALALLALAVAGTAMVALRR